MPFKKYSLIFGMDAKPNALSQIRIFPKQIEAGGRKNLCSAPEIIISLKRVSSDSSLLLSE
jgi:hypothetical protein